MASKSIQIVKSKSGELEFTVEGIQLLQNISGPLGIITVIGPPKSGKTLLCKKLLSNSSLSYQETNGIWAGQDTLKVIKREDDGTEYKLDVLIIDTESIISRKDLNKTRGLEILALACLISSHIVYVTDQPFHTQSMLDLDIFAELPNLISIRKKADSFKVLHEYLPVLTWVINGPDLKAPEETAGVYFEKLLNSQGSAESSKIKTAFKTFFRKRFCFNVVGNNKGHFHRLVEFLQQATPSKTAFGINLTGPVLCSMLQTYVSKLQKKSPAVIQSAFNRAVAAEARKILEKLYVNYLEQMTEVEHTLPCSEEELWGIHNSMSTELIEKFEASMIEFKDCSEISKEKSKVIERMGSFYEELKEMNYKQSEENARKICSQDFETVLKSKDFLEYLPENEAKILEGFNNYLHLVTGPAGLKVFVEECGNLVSFLCSCVKEVLVMTDSVREELEQEVERLKKSREKSRVNEEKMKIMLEISEKEFEAKMQQKDRELNDFQLNLTQKLNQSENKVRSLTRELKSKDTEIEHIRSEKEMIIDIERNLFSQKEKEYEDVIAKLKETVSQLEIDAENTRINHQKTLSLKDGELIELRQKGKLSEAATESIQDYSILAGLRREISDLYLLLETEQANSNKIASQADRITSLQAELNKTRLKEIESRNKLIEEYEEKIFNLKDELEKTNDEIDRYKKLSTDKPNLDERDEDCKSRVKVLENEIKIKDERNNFLNEMIEKRDEQIEGLYRVIDTHKKKVESLEIDYEDKESQLHKLKVETAQLRDDNDVLIGLMGYSLEVYQKKRNFQAINLGQIQSMSNRTRVIKIFKKFGIPYD